MRLKISVSFVLVLALVSAPSCTGTVETDSLDGVGAPAQREAVGTWLEDGPSGSRITIYREDGRVFMGNRGRGRQFCNGRNGGDVTTAQHAIRLRGRTWRWLLSDRHQR